MARARRRRKVLTDEEKFTRLIGAVMDGDCSFNDFKELADSLGKPVGTTEITLGYSDGSSEIIRVPKYKDGED